MRALIRIAIPSMGIVAMPALPLFCIQADSTRRTTLQLEFHGGTDMEAVPSPDGRSLALQLWSSDHTLESVTAGKLVRVDGRTGQQKTLLTQLTYQIPGATESLLLRKARLLMPEPLDGLWDVLLRDGRIQSLHRTGEYAARADRTMDLEGRTVIPGLLALHEHPFIGFPMEGYLYWGETSIASAGEGGHWAIARQEAIHGGRRRGPRIFPAGGFVVPTQFNAFPQMLRAKTPAQMDRYIDHLSGIGATQVKAYDRREPWRWASLKDSHPRLEVSKNLEGKLRG